MQHPAFRQPSAPNAVIWRYMGVAKFKYLIERWALFMARADRLGDNHEGTTPAAEIRAVQRLREAATTEEEKLIIEGNQRRLSEFGREFLSTYYVSCWHMSSDENIAMWERYVSTSDAVVVQSTFGGVAGGLSTRRFRGRNRTA
jgi:hypothetical protein